MRSYRLGLICLISVCVWLAAALPLRAQSRLLPLEEELLPPALNWEEQSIEAQLQQSPEGDSVELPATPMRSSLSGGGKGMGGMGGMGGPGGGSPFSAYSFFQPESNLVNQSGTLQVRGEGFALGLPVSIGPNGIWIVTTRLEHTPLRRTLDHWFDDQGLRPLIMGEFQDSALMKVFGQEGLGLFPAPAVISEAICQQYAVHAIGQVDEIRERFYAISVERRLKHPAVIEISNAAKSQMFGVGHKGKHQD